MLKVGGERRYERKVEEETIEDGDAKGDPGRREEDDGRDWQCLRIAKARRNERTFILVQPGDSLSKVFQRVEAGSTDEISGGSARHFGDNHSHRHRFR